VYFRIHTQSSQVGMYVFPYIHTEFMFVFIYSRTYTQGFHVCVSVYMHMYVAFTFTYMYTELQWVCMWLRIYIQRLHVFVFIYMYRYTELHVWCICAYMYTESTWMCVHEMIVSACTHVRGTG